MKKSEKEKLLDIIDTIKLIINKYELKLVVNEYKKIEIRTKEGDYLTNLDSQIEKSIRDELIVHEPPRMNGVTFTIDQLNENDGICAFYNYGEKHRYSYKISKEFINYSKSLNDIDSDYIIKFPTIFQGTKDDLDMIVYRLAILIACYGAYFNENDYTKLVRMETSGQAYVTTILVAGLTYVKIAILGNDQNNWNLVLKVLKDTVKSILSTKTKVF